MRTEEKKQKKLITGKAKPDYMMQIMLTINAFLVCVALVTKFIDPWFLILPYWLITGIRNMINLKTS